MPILFDDLKPGDIVSCPTPDEEALRYLLYIGKKKSLSGYRTWHGFVTKQLWRPYRDEPSYEILEAFQPMDLVRNQDAILAVYDELMVKDIPNSSYVWEHLGFESPEEADLPWHHLIRITLTIREEGREEGNRRKLSLVEKKMSLVKHNDLFKESRGRTTLDMPHMPPTKNKGGKQQ